MTRLLSLLILIGALAACTTSGGDTQRLERECSQALTNWQWQRLDSLTLLLEARTKQPNARVLYYRATYRPDLSEREMDQREQNLADALRQADIDGDDKLLSSIYNTMGVWELVRRRRYHTAQYYFNRAAETARRAGDENNEVAASLNLSEVCRILHDTIGRRTDLRLYDYARRKKDNTVMYASLLHLASYCVGNPADSASLRSYLDILRRIPEARWTSYAIEADNYLKLGQMERAAQAMAQAKPDQEVYSAYINLQILAQQGAHAEVISLADKLINNPLGSADLLDHADAMSLKARSLAALGRDGEAYRWEVKASQWRDSVSRALQLDQINRYKVEYQVAEKDFQIQAQESRLRLVIVVAVAVALVLVSVLAATLYYMRRRQQFYRQLVAQQLEQQKAAGSSAKVQPQVVKPECEMREDLYQRILAEVDGNQLWRDTTVTRETLADRLGTNRTYLSEAIKANTGMSYSQFMNSRRIGQAVKILADKADDTPLKQLAEQLGFLSLKTFYTSFKQATGVPPAAFRQTAHDLEDKAIA